MTPEQIEKLLADWLTDMKYLKGFADNTLRAYEGNVRIALKSLPPLSEVTICDVRKLFVDSDLAHQSVNLRLKALKSFFKFCEESGAVSGLTAAVPRSRRVPQRLPRALTVEKCFELLEFESAKGDWIGLRNKALWTLMWGAGLRVSEALSFTFKIAGERRETLVITGKGGKQRLVPVLPQVWQAIEDYIVAMPNAAMSVLDDDSRLFVTEAFAPFSPREAQREFAIAKEVLGLPEDASPHSLRHSFATHLLNSEGGCNLVDIKELMGHESVSTTAIYAHVATDRMIATYDKAHPRSVYVEERPTEQMP